MVFTVLAGTASCLLLLLIPIFSLHLRCRHFRHRWRRGRQPIRVGFLHPHCLTGGGGERVLWSAICAVAQRIPQVDIVLYAASDDLEDINASGKTIVELIRKQMKIEIDQGGRQIHIVELKWYKFGEAEQYPRLTLLLQTLGGFVVGYEALWKDSVDIMVDTAGHVFAITLAKLMGLTTVSYIHYPVISTDMLSVVRSRQSQFNNSETIARSQLLSFAKLVYYKYFAYVYGSAGCMNDFVIVNSTWTRKHIATIWGDRINVRTIFPPCDVGKLVKLSVNSGRIRSLIISIGQFRPEKNHVMQLEALKLLLENSDPRVHQTRLVIIGGTRNQEDDERALTLRKTAEQLGIEKNIEIHVNAPRSKVLDFLRKASIGIHTMRDEHFGISVVELMAAGLITIAHNSGGVCKDIIKNGKNGFLASSAQDYAEHIHRVICKLTDADREEMHSAARETAQSFSHEIFTTEFVTVMKGALAASEHGRDVNIHGP